MENLNNLTIWDVKDVFNKVKNVVMNYTEMEAKVREATNNEPWGASSTLMQEIAQGTYNYQYFNEIMPTIYKRFTEKEARQWRQIYKALVLLEYLVKHGSERVVDDARAHMATVKIMRNFAYIDEKNKDQGINVRNRARELAELLSDVEKIRTERKKAKANRTKYTSVSSDSLGYGGFGGSGSRYGGFSGGDSFGYSEDRTRSRYDDYDAQWPNESRIDRNSPPGERRSSGPRSSLSISKKQNESSIPTTTAVENTEVNLFDFETPPIVESKRDSIGNEFSHVKSIDDDFQDFQSAPVLAPPSQRPSITIQHQQLHSDLTNAKSHMSQDNPVAPSLKQSVEVNNNLIDDLLGPVSSVSSPPVATTSASTLDLWAEASNLVSLDSLGMRKDSGSTNRPSVAPSMNSMVQANNSSAWAAKGTWNSGPQTSQITSQKSQDPFDLLM
ncbi:119_t:CDS:2 [Ambispora gerdemannii]|uniref:119_t:CDS:1 n=1 Tax=Ambispora gerdemannii TaxID=144530 RepID=A0A9N8VL77_9GLOM|nr:119_t:CDS:2 [Ambispora gerdemannii]